MKKFGMLLALALVAGCETNTYLTINNNFGADAGASTVATTGEMPHFAPDAMMPDTQNADSQIVVTADAGTTSTGDTISAQAPDTQAPQIVTMDAGTPDVLTNADAQDSMGTNKPIDTRTVPTCSIQGAGPATIATGTWVGLAGNENGFMLSWHGFDPNGNIGPASNPLKPLRSYLICGAKGEPCSEERFLPHSNAGLFFMVGSKHGFNVSTYERAEGVVGIFPFLTQVDSKGTVDTSSWIPGRMVAAADASGGIYIASSNATSEKAPASFAIYTLKGDGTVSEKADSSDTIDAYQNPWLYEMAVKDGVSALGISATDSQDQKVTSVILFKNGRIISILPLSRYQKPTQEEVGRNPSWVTKILPSKDGFVVFYTVNGTEMRHYATWVSLDGIMGQTQLLQDKNGVPLNITGIATFGDGFAVATKDIATLSISVALIDSFGVTRSLKTIATNEPGCIWTQIASSGKGTLALLWADGSRHDAAVRSAFLHCNE